jgi:hypothetical protein
MSDHPHEPKRWPIWITISAVVVTLFFFGSALLYHRLTTHSTIVIETNGTARVGIIPLKNKRIRDMTLKGLAHVQSSTASLAVARSAHITDVVDMLNAMNRAGITSVVLKTESNSK